MQAGGGDGTPSDTDVDSNMGIFATGRGRMAMSSIGAQQSSSTRRNNIFNDVIEKIRRVQLRVNKGHVLEC
ncbi:uncharacterized protein GLRG_04569 [Colletotrichum graminicola M1.001]|uniref:Uncharacterized protein n=1 Tax=Colletotrichum graminicola (strain M1.001 / M2 / FGSC 10212) TaxID=645133 RepID=E3QEW9_COLGM|nr:uncharacterized protein GLRG_04569 [Colletotrichum graminicola M1.001]EFQ29425.1 hypothetical protein GLRG_04569 [Colletotrichum graminicola M1.001]